MRYALYHIPEQQSPLAMLGASLLGWDIYDAAKSDPKIILHAFAKVGLVCSQKMLEHITQEACRYGLHATLKAPFYLAEGCREEQLIEAVDAFAITQQAFILPPLQVRRIDNFIAITLQKRALQEHAHAQKIHDFAAQCLKVFEDFRRPPSAMELVRRRQKTMTLRQEEYLLKFGYPYVLEDFRFHITLCHLFENESLNDSLEQALGRIFAPYLQKHSVNAVYLCRSDAMGRFSILHKAPL